MPQPATPKNTTFNDHLAALGTITVAIILVLLPFHAVFTTWLGANFGHFDLFRIWKELLMIPLGLVCAGILFTDGEIRQRVTKSWLFWLTVAYVFLTLGVGAWSHSRHLVTDSALIDGLLLDTRFVTLLIFTWIIALKDQWLYQHWRELLLGPAVLVVAFGIAQWLLLPPAILTHFGYGPHTIPAIQTVDQQAGYRRLQSTLRGANPLGAYLVLIITAFAGTLVTQKQRRSMGWFLLAASTVLLFLSYSRSAYLGAALSVAVLLWFLLPKTWPQIPWRRWIAVGGVVAVLVAGLGIVSLRHNTVVEDVTFHTSQNSTAASSNNQRASALKQAVRDIQHQPLGRGPGTAGPASVRNNQPRLAENYYLQVAQETGVLGLGLFLAINGVVAWQLWRRRADLLTLILLASLVGIGLVNLVSHAWADDTLSLIWWGLAGVAIAQPTAKAAILNKRQTHGQTKTSKQKIQATKN